MISFAVVLLSFTANAAAHANMTPEEFQLQRTAAEQAHNTAMAALDQRQDHIMHDYNQRLQNANRVLNAELATIDARTADLAAIQGRAQPSILALRNELHGRFAGLGIFDALPSADPAVAHPVAVAAGVPAPVIAALAERNVADARFEAERCAEVAADIARQRASLNATILQVQQDFAREYRALLEQMERNRAAAVAAHEANLARLADLHARWVAEQAHVNGQNAIAHADAQRVAARAAQQAQVNAALLLLRA